MYQDAPHTLRIYCLETARQPYLGYALHQLAGRSLSDKLLGTDEVKDGGNMFLALLICVRP